mgnify:CR=1 FL=1
MMNEIDFQSLVSRFAPSTRQIYTNLWKRWQNWCADNSIQPMPITQEAFDQFISQMRSMNRSGQYVRHFLSVLRLVNEHLGYDEEIELNGEQIIKLRPPYILLNSAMMPAPGNYQLVEMTREDWAKAIQRAASEAQIQSYIGYPDTAKHVQDITGLPIEVNRAETVLGDSATMFIVKLKYRVSNPAEKGQFTPTDSDYAYYVARYTKA